MEESGVVEGYGRETTAGILTRSTAPHNFLRGIPHWNISSRALERDKQFIAGIVYDAAKDEMFMAEGQGRLCQQPSPARLRPHRPDRKMLIGTGIPHIGKGGHGQFLRELAAVMPRFSNVRRMGAAALDLAYVAAGRLDAYWEHGLNTWDFAGRRACWSVRQAGIFGTLDGKPATSAKDIICGNEAAETALRAALNSGRLISSSSTGSSRASRAAAQIWDGGMLPCNIDAKRRIPSFFSCLIPAARGGDSPPAPEGERKTIHGE